MKTYFWDGLKHFIFAITTAMVYFELCHINKFRNIQFMAGLILTSSALFFLPSHIPYHWPDKIYQFLHYPLPDWDLLFSGMKWHRFFLTHSFLIPFLLMVFFKGRYENIFLGMALGLVSHLLWDGITGSMKTPVVFIPGVFEMYF